MEVYPPNVLPLPPGSSNITSFQFTEHVELVGDVHVYCLVMKDSLLVWVGGGDMSMKNISVAIQNSSTNVLGNNETAARIASHLMKKFKGMAFVSYNTVEDDLTVQLVEKTLFAKLSETQRKN